MSEGGQYGEGGAAPLDWLPERMRMVEEECGKVER